MGSDSQPETRTPGQVALAGSLLMLLAAVGMVSWGCAPQNMGAPQPVRAMPPVEISITLKHALPGQPPWMRLQGEVVLRNDNSAPCWFLIPEELRADPNGGVHAVEVHSIGPGGGVVGRLLGRDNAWAFLLPPGGLVRIARLPIEYRGELPASVAIPVRMAGEISLAGKPLEQWFDRDPMNPARVDGELAWNAQAARRTPDNKEAPLVLGNGQALSVTAPVHVPGARP